MELRIALPSLSGAFSCNLCIAIVRLLAIGLHHLEHAASATFKNVFTSYVHRLVICLA